MEKYYYISFTENGTFIKELDKEKIDAEINIVEKVIKREI